jgi:tetratricopeptide (TPR) repeat protein
LTLSTAKLARRKPPRKCLNPNVAFYLNRGTAWGDKGDNDRAVADYSGAIRLNPSSAMALYLRGVAKQKKGDKAGGTADIAAAKRIDPNAARIEDQ